MRGLSDATSADEAARRLLTTLSAEVEAALDERLGQATGAIRRAMVSLSGPHGSEGVILRGGGAGEGWGGDVVSPQSSRTAVAALRAQGAAVCLDIPGRRLYRADGSFDRLSPQQVRAGTVSRMERAEVTHLLALPLRAPGRPSLGVVSLELRCPDLTVDTPWLVGHVGTELQLQVDLFGLFIALLPRALPELSMDGLHIGGALRSVLEHGHLLLTRGEAVLLLGPPGAGKAWLARQLHERGPWGGPFERLEGASVSSSQLGRALQQGGTTLIHACEGLSRDLQAQLYRALADEPLLPTRIVLSSRLPKVQIASPRALGSGLLELLADNVLSVPALAQRREEIPLRVADFLAERASETGDPALPVTEEAMDALVRAPWRENLGELRSVVRLLCRVVELRWRRTQGEAPREVQLRDVLDALEEPRAGTHAGLLDQLRPGCRALAQRAVEPDAALTLDDLSGLGGLVLAEALDREPDPWRLACSLGYRGPRRGGNYLKPMRAMAERARSLCETLGEPFPESLALLEVRARKA